MVLSSITFLGIYLPILLALYFNPFVQTDFFRKLLLLIASLFFFFISDFSYFPLLIGVIVINYCFVKFAYKTKRNGLRITAIVIDVLILVFFKYINSALGFLGIENGNIGFPVGLSYFIFKSISYVADSKKRNDDNFIDVALYISCFLTIVSGPLSSYESEIKSIKGTRKISWEKAYESCERVIVGFAKKIIIADSLSVLVEQCFSFGSELSVFLAWSGAIAYTLQLYFDFSGYTDIAIGIAGFFGYELPENFNYPYLATSVSDFWKRWHMSLTKWFTRYIYIPLGGSKVNSLFRHLFNLFVVWMVTGMWHGSSWNFIVWAMIYFVLQSIEKYTNIKETLSKIHLSRAYTLIAVIIEWVIFRSSDLSSSIVYLKSMFIPSLNGWIANGDLSVIKPYLLTISLGVLFSMGLGREIKAISLKSNKLNLLYLFALLVIFAISVIISLSIGYSAPLYANF